LKRKTIAAKTKKYRACARNRAELHAKADVRHSIGIENANFCPKARKMLDRNFAALRNKTGFPLDNGAPQY